MKSPLVSILIRTQNRPTLKRALKSVAAQNYSPLEVVIINDGGKDCRQVIESALDAGNHKNAPLHQYLALETPQGRSVAANHAMALASGSFWLFLDDDDLLLPNHVSDLVSAILNAREKEKPDIIGAYSAVRCISTHNKWVELGALYNHTLNSTSLPFKNILPIHSVLFDRKVYDCGCHFDESLDLYEDWHFWVQVIRYGDLIGTGKISALYELSTSGIGNPDKSTDHNQALLLFFKRACPFWEERHWLYLYVQEKFKTLLETNLKDAETSLTRTRKDYQKLETDFETVKNCLIMNNHDQAFLNTEIKDLRLEVERLAAENHDLKMLNEQLTGAYNQLNEQHNRMFFVLSKYRQYNPFYLIKQFNLMSKLRRLRFLSIVFWEHIERGEIKRALFKTFNKLKHALGQRDSIYVNVPGHELFPPSFHKPYERDIKIVSTRHTLYIARLIEQNLLKLGFKHVEVLPPDTETFGDALHFVVCPQMFKTLPGFYISFQMEQSIHSRWFTPEYFTILENSAAIMDYSQTNVRFLQKKGGLSYKQIFWTPVSNISGYSDLYNLALSETEQQYDVVFYGDIHNVRRKAFLNEIGKRFKLLIVSEVFGEALYAKLRQAKIVLNIHYYEDALLETTRLYECLSLGLPVISEESSDQQDHRLLESYVSFTPVGNIQAMCLAIENQLSISDTPTPRPALPSDISGFSFYLGRVLLSLDLMPRSDLMKLPSPIPSDAYQHRLGLSLPETFQRNDYLKLSQPNTVSFPGLRHQKGWIGAAMSYKYMASKALEIGLNQLEACEDDVALPPDFEKQLNNVYTFLQQKLEPVDWDIFCALIADLHSNTQVKNVYDYAGMRFVEIDHMTSMVFNIYNSKALKLISDWNPDDNRVETNAIDRYLEAEELRVITTLPFIVDHHEGQDSTLWGINNAQYTSLINKSEKRLNKLVEQFLQTHEAIQLHDE